ncbi:MAG: helix-turn-helix domain-containing protein [Oscillospiraceae bacterium]|nr:helix-turn-helix domain-containing protein [Oscillospiraceae bacterium]
MKADTNKLRIAMARACMNPQDLAKAAAMPSQTVNGALRGRSVRPATIGRIAKALSVDVTEIIKEEED